MSRESKVEKKVKEIKRMTRRKYSAEEKIRIVLEVIKSEDSIASICRREGINTNTYYNWSKGFMEAGKRRLSGDILREANRDQVQDLRQENTSLKLLYAELAMQHSVLKKSMAGLEQDGERA